MLALRDALGLGGGSRPTGVLVQRWVQQRGGSGAQPREIFFFTILMDFEAKSTNHTTYTAPRRKAHVQICADRRDLRGATPSAASRQSIVGLG